MSLIPKVAGNPLGGLLVAIALAWSAPAQAEMLYRNAEYGFGLALPFGFGICTDAPPSPNHGFAILLHPKEGCADLPKKVSEWISAFAYYNTPTEAEGAAVLADELCQGKSERTAPDRRIGGLVTEGCRVLMPSGKVELWLVAQGQRGDFVPGWVNYQFHLSTSPEMEAEHTAVLNEMVKGLTLLPIDP